MSCEPDQRSDADFRRELVTILDREWPAIGSIEEQRARVKNWAVTVWMAVVASLVSRAPRLARWDALLLMSLPPVLFWGTELMSGVLTQMREDVITEIEGLLAKETVQPFNLILAYGHATRRATPIRTKLRKYLWPAIKMETVILPYMALLIASVVVCVVVF